MTTKQIARLLAAAAVTVTSAACHDGVSPETGGQAQMVIVTAAGTRTISDARAGFYPYHQGPTEHDRAVYVTVGTKPGAKAVQIELLQFLPQDQDLPDPGTYGAYHAWPLPAGTAVYFTDVPELSNVHVVPEESSFTLETVSETRITGHFELVLLNDLGHQVATIHGTFEAPRVADYTLLPHPTAGT